MEDGVVWSLLFLLAEERYSDCLIVVFAPLLKIGHSDVGTLICILLVLVVSMAPPWLIGVFIWGGLAGFFWVCAGWLLVFPRVSFSVGNVMPTSCQKRVSDVFVFLDLQLRLNHFVVVPIDRRCCHSRLHDYINEFYYAPPCVPQSLSVKNSLDILCKLSGQLECMKSFHWVSLQERIRVPGSPLRTGLLESRCPLRCSDPQLSPEGQP